MYMQPFSCKLSEFEGPLDLLLHLVSKAKIDLQDIFVSEITEQYLSYMDDIGTLDMERASDFLNMAAMLLFIKSRSLLPGKRDQDEAEDGFMDPETELINRLRAYKLYKDAGGRLQIMEATAKNVFYKLPEELFDAEQEMVIEDTDADMLYLAFLNVLKRKKEHTAKETPQVEIRSDTFSIRRQKKKLLDLLKRNRRMPFGQLFDQNATQMEIAVTFVALLELWHIGRLAVAQRASFGEIILEYREGGDVQDAGK